MTIIQIYGHEHISVLNGGLNSWNKLKEIKVIKNAEDTDPDANNLKPEQIGHYRASWDSRLNKISSVKKQKYIVNIYK